VGNSTLNNGASPALVVNFHGAPAGALIGPLETFVTAIKAMYTDLQVIGHIEVGENDSTGGGTIANLTQPADYAAFVQSGLSSLVTTNGAIAGFCTAAPITQPPATGGSNPLCQQAGTNYPAKLAAIDNGTTLRYTGLKVTQYVMNEPASETDGLHIINGSNSGVKEKLFQAWGMYNLLTYGATAPSNSSGSGSGGGLLRRRL